MANKLKSCIARQVHYNEMIVEGIVTIASGESPGVLMLKLNNFGQQKKDEKRKKEMNRIMIIIVGSSHMQISLPCYLHFL